MRLIDADAFEIRLASIAKKKAKSEAQKALMGRCIFCLEKEPTIKAFTLADIEEQYRKGLEKGLEEAETKKCPFFSDDEVKQPCVKSPCGFERPRGKWEWKSPTPKTIMTPHCSNCGHMNDFLMETNFCPNCGADMRKR